MGDREAVKCPDSPSDLENGECGRKEGSCPTPLELLAAILLTWEYWQLAEPESSPNPCKLTLLYSSLSLSGVPSLFNVVSNLGPEVNTCGFFRKRS